MRTRALILAAGKGKRMKSEKTKVLHELNGKPIIEYVVEALEIDEIERIGVIVSENNMDEIKEHLKDRVDYIVQTEQLGTGHAVLTAEDWLSNFEGSVIVVVGDAPFLQKKTVEDLLNKYRQNNYTCLLLSAVYKEPPAYGRIIRDNNGKLIRIIEEKDATVEEKKIKEVSTSHYCFDKSKLFSALKKIKNNNSQGEYYLPDVIEIFIQDSEKIDAFPIADPRITFGINSPEDLKIAQKMMTD
jgi:bifunctional UDP-N-acetylglucosamine pyrophosphorylase/glucosamine-1-phosphate N-acetyltransferase